MRSATPEYSPDALVPAPIVLYAILGLADFGFTLAAFMIGATEANPALRWFETQGLFEFSKLSFILLVCCVAFRIWQVEYVPRVLLWANIIMGAVVLYHVAHWITIPI